MLRPYDCKCTVRRSISVLQVDKHRSVRSNADSRSFSRVRCTSPQRSLFAQASTAHFPTRNKSYRCNGTTHKAEHYTVREGKGCKEQTRLARISLSRPLRAPQVYCRSSRKHRHFCPAESIRLYVRSSLLEASQSSSKA